jgi:hypothetical protein
MRPLCLAGVVAMACAMQVSPPRADGFSPTWESAFPIAMAPAHAHFHARYLDGDGKSHTLEVWRDGERRLRRKSDDALDLYAQQKAGGEIDFSIVDHSHGIIVRTDRAALFRVGHFSGWFGFAHVLDVPQGAYRVTALMMPPDETKAGGPCRWYRLEVSVPAQKVSDICWSENWGLPAEIKAVNSNGAPSTVQFSVDKVDVFEPTDAHFTFQNKRFVVMDARTDDDLSD